MMSTKRTVLLLGVVLVLVLAVLVNGYRSGRIRQFHPVEESVPPDGDPLLPVASQPEDRRQPQRDPSDVQDPGRTAEELAEAQELLDELRGKASYLAAQKHGPPDDPELQDDAEEFMFAEVGDLLNRIPFYGMVAIPSNSVAKGRYRVDGSRVYVLETPELSTFIAEGTVSKMVISKAVTRSAHPEGQREMRFTQEQRDAIKRMQYVAEEVHMSDEAIQQVFNAAALEAGISEQQLGISDEHPAGVSEIERTKINPAKSIRQHGKPAPPEYTVGPDTDAYIKVTLRKPDDPEFRLFELEFRTVEVGENLYQPQVVRWICNAFD
jgi:hypothetical protein